MNTHQPPRTGHIVLLGDSIFDNASYVPGKPPVVEQLQSLLPDGWETTLLAVDGHVTSDVPRQLVRFPEDGTHIVVSVGGNDALRNSHIIDARASAAEAFENAAQVQSQFRRDYRRMLNAVMAKKKPAVICTIYDTIHGLPRSAIAALSIFNDVILREAFRLGLPVLDLRLICDDESDFLSCWWTCRFSRAISRRYCATACLVDSVSALISFLARRRISSFKAAATSAIWIPVGCRYARRWGRPAEVSDLRYRSSAGARFAPT
jgi:hypothetical protein